MLSSLSQPSSPDFFDFTSPHELHVLELMEAYQKSFMELDLACRGFLEIDALKVIMVLRGRYIDQLILT